MAENNEIKISPEQEAAISYRGEALLVTAAAGTGKTWVLVERLLKYIEEENDIDEFLVITFTRAAAAELRERIFKEISERLTDAHGVQDGGTHMWRQFMLCRNAQIGTIHSFCTDVLRENAHLAGLMPNFRVTDDDESAIIKTEVLDSVLDQAYETIETSDAFRNLVDSTSPGRDDRQLFDIILKAHAKLMSCPDLGDWIARQTKRLELVGVKDVAQTVWGEYLINQANKTARFWHEEMSLLLDEAKLYENEKFYKAYGSSIEQTIESIKGFIDALAAGWDKVKKFGAIEFPSARCSGFDGLKNVRKQCNEAMKKCTAAFMYGSDELLGDVRDLAPELTALLNLILEFDHAYKAEKLRRGAVDFSDLEHLCLSLLLDKETGKTTAFAKSISKRYKEILVDEYQDINAVQDMIISAISQEGKNVFMVGDVKQSIYRFRLADPSIFLEKYGRFREYDPKLDGKCGSGGVKIHLSKNFRSRAGILDAVNQVFGSIMSVEFGEMDYTEKEYLVAGRTDVNSEFGIRNSELDAQINLVDMSAFESDDEESISDIQAEARFIAGRIKDLVNAENAFQYSDVVILLRVIKNKAWQYAAALSELGIPSDLPGGEGYYDTIEVSAALSILKTIDNPLQDIPLAAALRSPAYGFTADELAEIRLCSKEEDFYTALRIASETNEKCRQFLLEMDSLRALAPDMPADRFIWHMYNKTGLIAHVGAMRGGEQRRENLILLAENARSLEKSGYKGLFGFLTYIQNLQEKVEEPKSEVSLSEQNSVRIMSIHKSKGLQFPVVFLAGTSSRITVRDVQQPILIHPEFGIGPKKTDLERRIKFTTVLRDAINIKLTMENMAEVQRVLYVAMTRAQEKLFIVAIYKDALDKLRETYKLASRYKANEQQEGKLPQYVRIPPQILLGDSSMASWILTAASAGESGKFAIRVYGPEGLNGEIGVNDSSPRPPSRNPLRSIEGAAGQARSDVSEEIAIYTDELRERFKFEYPFQNSVDMPSKLTVTEIKGKLSDVEIDEDAAFLAQVEKSASDSSYKYAFERPEFVIKKTGLTRAERGTALHLVMQHIEFAACGSVAGVEQEIDKLLGKGLLTKEQADVIDTGKVMRFFESDIGKRLIQAKDVRREFKFSLLYDAERFFPDSKSNSGGGNGAVGDKILVQGVVDCFFEENGELVVLDFKTDYVTDETIEEKAAEYARQINAYAEALERITGKQVKERVIYFFAMDKAYVV